MRKKILVTGATGNVGFEVLKLLKAQNIPLSAAILDTEYNLQKVGVDTPKVILDFYDPTTYQPALENIEKIFLMRPPQIAEVKKYINPFIDQAIKEGIKHIAFLSLMGGNPFVPHYKIERHIKKRKIPYTFLRASFFMQNMNTTHQPQIKDTNEIFIPAGKGKISFIDVRDIAAVAVKALLEPNHTNKTYNLTGGEALDFYQVSNILSTILERKINYTNPHPREFQARMIKEGYNEELVDVMNKLYFIVKMGKAGKITPDTKELLGREPIKFEQYAKDYAHYWQ
ncbi:MAG: SDR family oxidoreductase [Candidatus Hermodarchaeota archaeon]